MNLTTFFQTAYTVCFILAGVLFATAVFVFFRFNILGVIENLSGIKISGKRGSAAGGAGVAAERKKKNGKTERVLATGSVDAFRSGSEADGTVENTVWMDTRGTSCLEDSGTEYGQTGELESTTGALDADDIIGGAEALAKAKAAIRFIPEKKIVIIHSEERI